MSAFVHFELAAQAPELEVKHTFLQEKQVEKSMRSRAYTDSAMVAFKPTTNLDDLSDQETEVCSEEAYLTDDEDVHPSSSWSSASSQGDSVPQYMISPAMIPQQNMMCQPTWMTLVQPSMMVFEPQVQEVEEETAADKTSRRRRQRNRGKNKTSKQDQEDSKEDSRTTVMLRNLPRDFSRQMLLDLLDVKGFVARYNFVYIPIDFVRKACLGYAFVNLTTPDVVPEFWEAFEGFKDWCVPCQKTCRVHWSTPHQGAQAHFDRYRNSPLMHEDVPDECRPIMLVNGVRVNFPPPTKTLRAPRLRASRQRCPFWNADGTMVEADGCGLPFDDDLDME